MADNTLRQLMLRLPQELWDEVFSLVFTLPTRTRVLVDDVYHPPSQLHVYRTMQKRLNDAYYRDSTFVLATGLASRRWIHSLTHAQFNLIKRFQVSTACASAETGTRLKTESDGVMFHLDVFASLMRTRSRYSGGYLPEDNGRPGRMTLTYHTLYSSIKEHWLLLKSESGTLFSKVE